MMKWFGDFLDGLPGWGKVAVVVAVVLLLAFALWMGRDLSPIWSVLD